MESWYLSVELYSEKQPHLYLLHSILEIIVSYVTPALCVDKFQIKWDIKAPSSSACNQGDDNWWMGISVTCWHPGNKQYTKESLTTTPSRKEKYARFSILTRSAPEQNGLNSSDDIFVCNYLNWMFCILIKLSTCIFQGHGLDAASNHFWKKMTCRIRKRIGVYFEPHYSGELNCKNLWLNMNIHCQNV